MSRLSFYLLTLATACLMLQTSIAQLRPPAIDYLPKSPAAAAYSRYGEIPVNHSTGIPNIEIPIYTIKIGTESVPISISYHASGIKVNDAPTEVGLGFVLNYGGVITANIVGRRDIEGAKPVAFKKSLDIDNAIWNARSTGNQATTHTLAESYWNLLTNPYGNIPDFFSDRYNYSLCTGESGTFRRDFTNNQIRIMPYRPVQISLQDGVAVEVVASNGYKHFFSNVSTDGDYYVLNKIVSADRTEEVNYNYGLRSVPHLSYSSMLDWRYEELVVDPYVPSILKLRNQLDGYSYSNLVQTDQNSTVSTPLVESILTKNEVITFQYATDRLDRNNNGNRLIAIIVTEKSSNQIIKKIQLNHSYFGTQAADNLRLRLDNIKIYGSTNDVEEKYSFTYNNMPLPAFPTISQAYCSEDYWGYYNGTWSNNFIPSFFSNMNVLPGGYNFANREVNPAFNQACILTRIDYPTGGKTEFEYQSNILPGIFPQQIVGGVRISKITSYTDATSKAYSKTYEYNAAVAKQIFPADFWYQQECWIVHKLPLHPPFAAAYHKNIGLSSSLKPVTVFTGAPVIYTSVTEYIGDQVSNQGKTVYAYSYEDNEHRNPMPGNIETRFFNAYHSDQGNYQPELEGRSIYKYVNGSYELIETEEHYYQKYKQSEFNTGVNFASNVEVGIENWGIDRHDAFSAYDIGTAQLPDGTYTGGYDYLSNLVYTDTKGYEEVSLLTSSVNKKYINGAVASQETTTYEYDGNTLLKRKNATNSKGEAVTFETTHPADYPSQAPFDVMVTRNILSPIIEETIKKDNIFLQSQKTNYDFWNGTSWSITTTDIIVPRTVETRRLAYPPETAIRFHTYDSKANVTSVSKENDVMNAYIWGYNKQYPVAKAINSEFNDIAATSFETSDLEEGNWIRNGATSSDPAPPTGKMVYDMNSGYVVKAALNPATTYVVSYWTKNISPYNIAGTLANYPISGQIINGWKYFEHRVSGQSSVTLSGTGLIDELRLYPVASQMTTYTYEPLKGMTSETDPNGRTTYYEYDSFNRLKHIKDKDGNIIKKFCYNYAGQTINCN